MILYIAPGERGGVPVLPEIPGPEDRSFWRYIRDGLTTKPQSSGKGTGVVISSPTPAAEPATVPKPGGYTPPPSQGGPYCFGADVAICETAPPLLRGSCYVTTGVVCLTVGIFVFLALIGIGVNALVRS